MRSPRIVAWAALIAVLASVAVPRIAGSRNPSVAGPIARSDFARVDVGSGAVMTNLEPDPASASGARLAANDMLRDGAPVATDAAPRPQVVLPAAPAIVREAWTYDREISWYGPGFYGSGTACGQKLTETLLGVAHRSLPCGTRVSFMWQGRTITVPVVDRGPYVSGRIFDLTKGACAALHHCFTGPIYYHIG